MYIVILRLTDPGQARELMQEHNAWIQRGFDDGVFLLVGGLQGEPGGAILAHAETLADLELRVRADPLVDRQVAEPTILSVTPNETDARLAFLQR